MNHPRSIIRKAVHAAVAASVLPVPCILTRPDPLNDPHVPGVLVYFGSEDNDILEGHILNPARYERKLTVLVDIVLSSSKNPENDLDTMAWAVEEAFYKDPTFGIRSDSMECTGSRMVRTTPVSFSSQSGDKTFWCQRLEWIVTYETDTYVAGHVDEFLSFNVDYADSNEPSHIIMESVNVIRTK